MLRVRAQVLPGSRIEIQDPNLPDGATVEVTVSLPSKPKKTLAQVMRECPPSDTPQAVESWERYEQLLQEEREAWDH
ncbi:MAG: hypothetical protein KIT45_00390 [Fimbriimonadia bacterium]|nr:hypothetical protein [Fimbriimonadia bacterium]